MVDTCQNPSIQVRLSLIFPLILVRFTWNLEQIQQRAPPMRLSKVIDEQANFYLELFYTARR